MIPMLATLTSKGQVTLPKQIRDKLGLKAGSNLNLPDGTVKLRPANRTPLSIMGNAETTRATPVSIEEIDEGIAAFLERKHGRKR